MSSDQVANDLRLTIDKMRAAANTAASLLLLHNKTLTPEDRRAILKIAKKTLTEVHKMEELLEEFRRGSGGSGQAEPREAETTGRLFEYDGQAAGGGGPADKEPHK